MKHCKDCLCYDQEWHWCCAVNSPKEPMHKECYGFLPRDEEGESG